MKYNIWKSIIDTNKNGIIILNLKKEVIYANNKIKGILGDNINELVGNYFKCKFTAIELTKCQTTTNCTICSINRALNKAIETGNTQVLKDIKIDGLNYTSNITISIHNNENLVIEIFELSENFKKLTFLNKILDKSHDFMFFKNSNLQYEYINESYAHLLGKPKEYIYGKTDIDLIQGKLLSKEIYNQCIKGDIKALETGKYHCIENFDDKYYRVVKENIDN